MPLTRDVLVSLLRLTQTSPAGKDTVQKDSRMPTQILNRDLSELSRNGLIEKTDDRITASPKQRVRLAFLALQAGADFKRVCDLLSWSEFEKMAADAFELNGYQVVCNFHFKDALRRWEIDIVALKKPSILCVDCKHWKRGWRAAATAKAAEAQTDRTEAFARVLPDYVQKMKLERWQSARLIPIILSLQLGPVKFHDGVPIVPVLQLQDFISEMPAHNDLLKVFYQKNLERKCDLQRFIK